MSIVITNITEKKGGKYGVGEQHYVMRINEYTMAEFTHNYEDGLSECLRSAGGSSNPAIASSQPMAFAKPNCD